MFIALLNFITKTDVCYISNRKLKKFSLIIKSQQSIIQKYFLGWGFKVTTFFII